MLTTTEVAEKLRVSDRTVRTWISSGKLKAFRVNKIYRINESDLDEFIKHNIMGNERKK